MPPVCPGLFDQLPITHTSRAKTQAMNTTFNVIIAGSRGFNDLGLLRLKCDQILKNKTDVVVISGTAQGADRLGELYAMERGFEVVQMPADWTTHGKRAGYLRNEAMAEKAHALIAFWDGQSKGTKHMIDIAKAKKLMVRVILYNNEPHQ